MADTSMDGATVSKRSAKCSRTFKDNAGNITSRASGEVSAVIFTFPGLDNRTLVMQLNDLPESIIRAAAAFGINTSVGNTFGGTPDPEEAFELAEARWERLKEGEWSAERGESGPRTGDLVEAVRAAKTKAGATFDEAAFVAKLQSGELKREAVTAIPAVKAEIDAIKLKRLQERAAKSAEAAKASAGDLNAI